MFAVTKKLPIYGCCFFGYINKYNYINLGGATSRFRAVQKLFSNRSYIQLKGFSAELWRVDRPIFQQRVLTHPFNQGLLKGTLSERSFYYFLEQDQIYLKNMAAALKKISSDNKISSAEAEIIRDIGNYIKKCEIKLINRYLGLQKTKYSINPACYAYIQHVRDTAKICPHMALASIFPCFLLYYKIGICREIIESNKYEPWLHSYSSEKFLEKTHSLAKLINSSSEAMKPEKKIATQTVFSKSVHHEISLWNEVVKVAE